MQIILIDYIHYVLLVSSYNNCLFIVQSASYTTEIATLTI